METSLMKPAWHFEPFKPRDTLKDPIEKALFSQDAVGSAAASVVREAIQNSLDARLRNQESVTVSFRLRTGRMSASAVEAAPFLGSALDHLHGHSTGLDTPPPHKGAVPFLVVEDFGTKGLTGDPAQWRPSASAANPFSLFFRALGRSGKKGEERGRWGVGKYVFPMVSNGNCWFGLTIPYDNSAELLMGRMVLKTHNVAGRDYHPDGVWGVEAGTDSPVMPLSGGQPLISEFRKCFSVQRRRESGLTVVVPWLKNDVTGQAILSAAVREYFFPILRGELTVRVDDNGSETVVGAASLESRARELNDPTLQHLVSLAMEAATMPESKIVRLARADRDAGPSWDDELVPGDARAELLRILDVGEVLAVRVPFAVKLRAASPHVTWFDVFVRRAEGVGRVAPTLVRDGITISDAKVKQLQDHVALVVVTEPALAGLVGDAENPAHTQILHQLITEKYVSAKQVLSLLREAPYGILRTLAGASDANDPFLLADVFPVSPKVDDRGPRKKNDPDTVPRGPIEVDGRPLRYRIEEVENGFAVTGVNTRDDGLADITVTCAYDVRNGSAFSNYESLDFRLDSEPISIEDDGLDILEIRNNQIVARPLRRDYRLKVTGFDARRDLFVRVTSNATES